MRGRPILLILAATMPAATARADFVITSTPLMEGPIIETIPDKPPDGPRRAPTSPPGSATRSRYL